jgi:hypothetical protein
MVNCKTLETDLPKRDRPAARVIAQQYFCAIFVLLCCHIWKGKFGARFENFLFQFFKFLKSRKSEIA